MENRPVPEEDEREILIGDDGEFLEPDANVDPAKYAQYVAAFNLVPRQHMNEWDEARIVKSVGTGCAVLLVIAFIYDVFAVVMLFRGVALFPFGR